jgi:hypothetical protein
VPSAATASGCVVDGRSTPLLLPLAWLFAALRCAPWRVSLYTVFCARAVCVLLRQTALTPSALPELMVLADRMQVPKLQQCLVALGYAKKGNKPELLARLKTVFQVPLAWGMGGRGVCV